jgi:hypothetical protein
VRYGKPMQSKSDKSQTNAAHRPPPDQVWLRVCPVRAPPRTKYHLRAAYLAAFLFAVR